MKENKPKKKGFTLIEVIFAVAILVFMFVAITYLYNNYYNVYFYQQTNVSVADSAHAAMNELQNAALQADKIITSHTFSGKTYSTDQHTLVLEIPSIDDSGNIVDGKYDYVVFYTTGTNLYKRIQADAASSRSSNFTIIGGMISALTFTYNNADLSKASEISTDIDVQKAARKRTVTYHLKQEIYLRNI